MHALIFGAVLWIGLAATASGQGAEVPFGTLEHDPTQPFEVSADSLSIDQSAGIAIFAGNVVAGQGELRLAADRIEVEYADEGGNGAIRRMVATGNVTLTNGLEAAEADRAIYLVADGIMQLEGDVLLTQGANTLSGQNLRIDLSATTAVMEGRVQTIFSPGARP